MKKRWRKRNRICQGCKDRESKVTFQSVSVEHNTRPIYLCEGFFSEINVLQVSSFFFSCLSIDEMFSPESFVVTAWDAAGNTRHLDYYFCVDGKRVFWGDSNKKFHTQHIKLRMYSLSTSIQSSSSSFCPLSPSHIPGIPWDEISSEAGFQDQILRPVCIHGIFICCLWRTRDSGIAVLVLIVGHSFSFFSDGSLYDGSVLSSFGNIVVVTIDICLVSISLTFLLWIL